MDKAAPVWPGGRELSEGPDLQSLEVLASQRRVHDLTTVFAGNTARHFLVCSFTRMEGPALRVDHNTTTGPFPG